MGLLALAGPATAAGASAQPGFARKYQLPFPLLSDPDGHTAAAYGSLLNLGLLRLARRHTFIIAPDGRIAARFDKVDPARHAEEVTRTLQRLNRPGTTQAAPPSGH